MSVEKVILYRSVDGDLHPTEQACLARNFALETKPKIMALIERHDETSETQLVPADSDAICKFILQFTPELVALMQPLVTPVDAPKRARRSKAELALEKAAQAVLQAQTKGAAASAGNQQASSAETGAGAGAAHDITAGDGSTPNDAQQEAAEAT